MTTALVLSAGGLFGAYQAGVWKHLRRFVQPDLVIGASIGAVNGWRIACDPMADLEADWLGEQTRAAIQLKPGGNLARGYFEPEPLLRAVTEVYDAGKPRIPYWLVVVEVPRFRTRLIPAAYVTARHLAASCSIYLFYPNVRIGARNYTDGGLFGHLPLWAAAQLGATRIIAIDCLQKLSPWWVQAVISTLHQFGPRRKLPADVRILRPSEPLGDAQSAMKYEERNIRRWMALGEKDAQIAFSDGV